jgi:hypothetical protein
MRILLGLALIALTGHAALAQHEIFATIVDDKGKPVADAVVVAVPADGGIRLPKRGDGVIANGGKEVTP